jgi:hypothetical protein
VDRLIPIVELSVAEAYTIVTEKLGIDRRTLPPLDAIENEDWRRDLLLSRLAELPDHRLADAGLCRSEVDQSSHG